MARPLHPQNPNHQEEVQHPPKTVVAAKIVEVALVSYTDERGELHTQLAIVGENKAHMLDSRPFGISRERTPQGVAAQWLTNGIFQKLSEGAPAPTDGEQG